jgi:hypothetical protein
MLSQRMETRKGTPAMDKPWAIDLWDAIDEYVRVTSKISGYKLEDGVKAAAAVEAVVHKIAAGGYSEPATARVAK